MNPALADALQQLHLEPGTYRCELAEQEIVVQVRPRKAPDAAGSLAGRSELKTAETEINGESCLMLDPWVELPGLSGGIILEARLGQPDLPDVPEIPPYDEGDVYGMLHPWVELPSPKPIGTVIARFAPPPPPDIPEIPPEDDML